VIGIGLLATQKLWVPKVVGYILSVEVNNSLETIPSRAPVSTKTNLLIEDSKKKATSSTNDTDVKKIMPDASSASQSSETVSPRIYINEAYGFTLTFPTSWADFRVTEHIPTNKDEPVVFDFGIKGQNRVFMIIVTNRMTWDRTEALEEPHSTVILKTDTSVYSYYKVQDVSDDVLPLFNQITSEIIPTFALTKGLH
jgi:hypothetical protein